MYPLKALPREVRAKIRRPAQPKPTQPAPADSASTQNKPNDKKRLFLGLGPDQRVMVDAKAEAVVLLWRHYKRRLPGEISIPDAGKAFCALWKAGHAGAEERARKALPAFGISSLYNWDRALAKGGLNALVEQRRQDAAPSTKIHGCATWFSVCWLSTHMPTRPTAQGLSVRFSSCPHHPALDETMEDGEQGALGTPMRSGRCERSLRCLHRTGRRSCGSLNALWEIDATTADVLLSDGQRHTILGIIDVWSRRVLLHVTRTSPSSAVCTALRRAILAWGVPSAVRCDNGKEFISKHTRTALKDLGIAQETAPPFQPERKPFIERALGTFSHDLLELLPGFCSHDVSDRQAIRSRRSFSARFGRGENAEGRLTPEAFQEFCDKWCALYVSRPHQGLGGLTPRLQLDRSDAYDRGRARAGYPALRACTGRCPHGAQKRHLDRGSVACGSRPGCLHRLACAHPPGRGGCGKDFRLLGGWCFSVKSRLSRARGCLPPAACTRHTQGAGRDAAQGQESHQGCVPSQRHEHHRSRDTGGRGTGSLRLASPPIDAGTDPCAQRGGARSPLGRGAGDEPFQ